MATKQISCQQYDYIEIVCMNQYPIKITTSNNNVIECIALDTKLNENRVECIKVKENDLVRLIELVNILHLQICIENPYFKSVSFGQ